MAACSSDDDTVAPATTTSSTTIPVERCEEAADAAIEPLQAFVDEYADLTPEEWNALIPPPTADAEQAEMVAIAQAAVDEGCNPTFMEELLAERIADLTGEGEVGRAIAAALRGDGPILGPPVPILPTTVPREEEASTVIVEPGDDLDEILATVAPGSTIWFGAGVHEFDEPIVVDIDLNFRGAGADSSVISSSAEGVAVTFVGPGGFTMEDLTIEHVGDAEASVFLAIEGPVRISDSVLRGGVAGTEEAGGGHGLVFAFDQLPGFPERTDAERAGDLVIERTTITDNAAAGVLVTGAAAPSIVGSTIEGNGGCGVCYTSRSGGTLRTSTVSGNQIGVQVSDTATPTIDDVDVQDSTAAGISIDGTTTVTVTDTRVVRNSGVGIQATGDATVELTGSTVSQHQVGVLAAGETTVTLAENTIDTQDIGVQVGGSATVDTVRNVLRASLSAAVSYGDDSTGRIGDNAVTDAPEAAIQAIGRSSPAIENNLVSTPGGVGVSVIEEATSLVDGNEIRDREIGIQVGGTAAPTVRDNTVLDSVAVGILFGDDASGSASDNTVTSPEAVGILAGGTSDPEIRGNRVVGNGVGIVFREQATGLVQQNEVRQHTIGMQIVDGAAPLIYQNHIEASTEAGVAFAGTSTARFEQNTVVRNGNLSVQVAESAAPDIVGNEIRGPDVYGIVLRDAAAGRVRDNLIVNHVYGIQVDGTASPSITGNSLEEIALTSIVYDGASGGAVSGNTCTQTFTAGISISSDASPTVGDNDCTVSGG